MEHLQTAKTLPIPKRPFYLHKSSPILKSLFFCLKWAYALAPAFFYKFDLLSLNFLFFMLEKEFQYYLDNQPELVKTHSGKCLVIKNQSVIGVFDTEQNAYLNTKKVHELGTFLIQKCEPGTAAYTQIFHGVVAFV